MYLVKEIWQELKMDVEKKIKPTEKQQSIFNYCEKRNYTGIWQVVDIFIDYTENNKCNRDYFIDVISTRWTVFRDDGRVWVDFDSPVGDIWQELETSL